MKSFRIHFELFSKKMKTTIKARNKQEALNILKDKIIIHKVEEQDDTLNRLKDMFNMN
jgi:hypothetical protein